MKTNKNCPACSTAKNLSNNCFSLLKRGQFVLKLFSVAMLWGALSATYVQADALTGLYTQVALGDPDFGGGSHAGSTLGTGLVQSQLGPDGLPVLSAAGISRLGTSSDMNPTTHELLWWSAGWDPYVSLDSISVVTDTMPLNFGYPNMNWYSTGQTGDQNFYRTVHWEGTFNMASAGQVSLTMGIDDDVWVFIDGTMVLEDHYGYDTSTSTAMSAGKHSIDMFYDDRFPDFNAIRFTSSVPLSPVPEPGTIILFVPGVVSLLAYGCRKTRVRG